MPGRGEQVRVIRDDMGVGPPSNRDQSFRPNPGVIGHMRNVGGHVQPSSGRPSSPVAPCTASSSSSGRSRIHEIVGSSPAPSTMHTHDGLPIERCTPLIHLIMISSGGSSSIGDVAPTARGGGCAWHQTPLDEDVETALLGSPDDSAGEISMDQPCSMCMQSPEWAGAPDRLPTWRRGMTLFDLLSVATPWAPHERLRRSPGYEHRNNG